jgi:hypothetical protein
LQTIGEWIVERLPSEATDPNDAAFYDSFPKPEAEREQLSGTGLWFRNHHPDARPPGWSVYPPPTFTAEEIMQFKGAKELIGSVEKAQELIEFGIKKEKEKREMVVRGEKDLEEQEEQEKLMELFERILEERKMLKASGFFDK